MVVDDVKELDGLSQQQIGAAAQAAKSRGLEGKWVITLQNTTIQPPLEQMKNRELRLRVFSASVSRGDGGDADNTRGRRRASPTFARRRRRCSAAPN